MQLFLFAVALHDDIIAGIRAEAQSRRHIRRQQHAIPVNAENAVALHQHALALRRKAVRKALNHRLGALSLRQHQNEHNEKSQQEIHQRTGSKNQRAPANRRTRQRARLILLGVLAFHDAGAAERQNTQLEIRLADFLVCEGRTHADPKFEHMHTGSLCRHEVSELMDDDQTAKRHNC